MTATKTSTDSSSHLQIRTQLMIPLLLLLGLLFVGGASFHWIITQKLLEQAAQESLTHLQAYWEETLKNDKGVYEALLKYLEQLPELQKAWTEQDRDALLAITSPLLDQFKADYRISHFYFHNLDGTNFLRVHNPNEAGDTIERYTFEKARLSQKSFSGLEIGAHGQLVLRTILPWQFNGQTMGYIELGGDIENFTAHLSAMNLLSVGLAIKKQYIQKDLWGTSHSPKEQLRWDQNPSYYIAEASDPALDQEYLQTLNLQDKVFTQSSLQPHMYLASLPIRDVQGRTVGKLLLAKDFSQLIAYQQKTGTLVLIVLIGISLAFSLFYYLFAGRLKDSLNSNIASLLNEVALRTLAEENLKSHKISLEKSIEERTSALQAANEKLEYDIQRRKHIETALKKSEEKYRTLFNGSTDMILVIKNGKVFDANLTAVKNLEIKSMDHLQLIALDKYFINTAVPKTLSHQWLKQAEADGIFHGEINFGTNGSNSYPVEMVITSIDDGDEKVLLMACRDISARKTAQALVEYQARFDPLTDLPNRRSFVEQLQQSIQVCRRHNEKGAVLFIDLDHFKNINDTLGHSVGDLLLKDVASRLKSSVRIEDTVSRFGGDEFVVILPRAGQDTDETSKIARTVAEKILESMTSPYQIEGHQLHITPSIGISIFPNRQETSEDILKQADAALYGAKDSGRNTLRFFEPEMQQANEQRLLIEKELRQALKQDQFFITLQTKHHANGDVVGSECLIRWQHPDMGMVSPLQFIGVAEETGFIIPIGHWVIEQAAQWIRRCDEGGLPQSFSKVAINLSPVQLYQPNFVQDLWSVVNAHQLAPERMILEITENVLIKDFGDTVKLLKKLKDLGFSISIDDFGTGYSSLRYLKQLPIDELKIDQSFVREIHTDANDKAIVETIISMARHLSLEVVAEGVENREQLEFLANQGCDRFQGYYFARPIPAAELYGKLSQNDQRVS